MSVGKERTPLTSKSFGRMLGSQRGRGYPRPEAGGEV